MTPVYLDDDLLVLNKEAGLLCVPGKGADKQDCLSARAQALWPGALVVHRLDQATSGLVVLARNPATQIAMGRLFEARQIRKTYVAWVWGSPALKADHWEQIDLPIAADWAKRPLRVIDPKNGKPATTRWRLAGVGEAGVPADLPYPDAAPSSQRVILEPQTGRTHQLRVHLQAVGHPILGDRLYGTGGTHAQADEDIPRLMLHACALAFVHPTTGAALRLTALAPF